MVRQFLGQCMGVKFMPRGHKDPHVCVQLMVEDDGVWHVKGTRFSSAWIPELIQTLQLAQDHLEKNAEPDMHNGRQYGYNLKASEPNTREDL